MDKKSAALLLEKEYNETGDLNFRVVGQVKAEESFTWHDVTVSMEEALDAWKSRLEKVFPDRKSVV